MVDGGFVGVPSMHYNMRRLQGTASTVRALHALAVHVLCMPRGHLWATGDDSTELLNSGSRFDVLIEPKEFSHPVNAGRSSG